MNTRGHSLSIDRRTRILLVLIWSAFLLRGVFYSTFTPLWEGWDEYWHFAFIQHLQLGRGLPEPDEHISGEIARSLELTPLGWTLSYLKPPSLTHEEFWKLPKDERMARLQALQSIPRESQTQAGWELISEGKQPPLYYWLASFVLRSVAGESLVTREFVLRIFSVLLASSVVFLSFACFRRVFEDDGIALQAAALITAMPLLMTSISRVSNEAPSVALFSLLTYWLLRAAEGDRRSVLGAEITLGLGLLTKAYFVAAVPAVAFSALWSLWREPAPTRLRLFVQQMIAAALGLAVCLWWYVRTLSKQGPVWDDAAPAALRSVPELLHALRKMEWLKAMDFTFNSHVWLGGWSVLSVRSWMYHSFRYAALLGFLGLLLFFVRWLVKGQAHGEATAIAAILYGGFWCALLYHAFVSFSKGLAGASGGWYLMAAIVPEVLLLLTGYWQLVPRSWRSNLVTGTTLVFVLLEGYAIHFLSFPYYTGITHHTSGALNSFHIRDAAHLGWSEVFSRMLFNKPEMVSPALFAGLWVAFVVINLSLPFLVRPRVRQAL